MDADAAMKDFGLPVRTAAQYEAGGVLFLDDMIYGEPGGFWVRAKSAAEFVVMPAVPSPVIRLLVTNGASPNHVSIESGTFQRMLVMSPNQPELVEIPAI